MDEVGALRGVSRRGRHLGAIATHCRQGVRDYVECPDPVISRYQG